MAVPAELDRALTALAVAPTVLVALDFDGTLAPEVDDPLDARALPEAQAAIVALRELERTEVALVSGRALDSLSHVGQLPADAPLVGSHGIELHFGDGSGGLSEEENAARGRLFNALTEVADRVENCWIEHKPAGFAIHTRLVAAESVDEVLAAAREAAHGAVPELTERTGKNVLEFALRDATKGDGVAALREHFAADGVLFAGDDVTDEDGFAALGEGDVAVKVGDAETRAEHRVADPAAMAGVLERLLELRRAHLAG